MARAATPAIAALLADGTEHQILRYQHDPRAASFGDEAVTELAAAHGLDPAQIFKTLILAVPGGLAVAVLPVPSKLSLKAAAAALNVPKAAMADRAAAERSTGYVLGGISPLGQRRALPTVIDSSALRVLVGFITREPKIPVRIVNPSPSVTRVVEFAGLKGPFGLAD